MFDMVSGNARSRYEIATTIDAHVPCESASHLTCTMLAVLNNGWRDQMPVSTVAWK